MPGTGHSHRFKSSISNRNTKPAFQVLAPWNSRKNGEKNQVAVSTGGDDLNFKLMGAKMMSNYKKASDVWELDCSLVVLGNKIVDGSAIIHGNVDICGNLFVKEDATFYKDVDICGNLRVWGKVTDLSDVDICGNLRVWGKVTDLSDVDICGNLKVKEDATFYKDVDICGNLTIKGHTEGSTAYFTDLSAGTIYDVSDNILTLGNHIASNNQDMRGIFASYHHTGSGTDKFGFFGLDPSFNGGVVDDTQGQFLFQTDASFANTHVPNIFNGQPGRACFGTLDISGSTRYGGGGSSGVPTQDVSGQSGSSMHLVGKTIIAQNLGVPARLDISGGLNVVGDISANEAIAGGSFAINYTNVDISGTVSVDISGGTTTIDASTALNIGPVGTSITIGNSGANVDISGGLNVVGDISANEAIAGGSFAINYTNVDISGTVSVDISGGTTTIDASTALNIGPVGTSITIGNSGANVDISGSTVDISAPDISLNATDISLNATDAISIISTHSDIELRTGTDTKLYLSNGSSTLTLEAPTVDISFPTTINIGKSSSTIDISATSLTIDGGVNRIKGGIILDAGGGDGITFTGVGPFLAPMIPICMCKPNVGPTVILLDDDPDIGTVRTFVNIGNGGVPEYAVHITGAGTGPGTYVCGDASGNGANYFELPPTNSVGTSITIQPSAVQFLYTGNTTLSGYGWIVTSKGENGAYVHP